MRKAPAAALAVLVWLLVAPGLASAGRTVQVLTVRNAAHVRPRLLHKVERAVTHQVDEASRWWNLPRVRFGPGGWQVTLVHGSPVVVCGQDADGCHSVTGLTDQSLGDPWAYVGVQHQPGAMAANSEWEDAFSHEILEMLTNPTTLNFDAGATEVCDVTEGWDYMTRSGVWLSDFALPEAYAPVPHGRVDYARDMSAREMVSEIAWDTQNS